MAEGKLDKTRTKKVVEEKLALYRGYKKKLGIDESYGRVTEMTERMERFVNLMEYELTHLTDIQQELVVERYLKNQGRTYDYIVQSTIMVAERTYYRIKTDALLALADGLDCEVYKD